MENFTSSHPSKYGDRKLSKIYVALKSPLLAEGIKSIVYPENEFQIKGSTSEYREALKYMEKEEVDIGVVDCCLPNRGSTDIITELLYRKPLLKILVVSMLPEFYYTDFCLKAGAKGYIMSDNPCDEIVEALRTISDDKLYTSEEFKQWELQKLSRHKNKKDLSQRQWEVLFLLGQGKSNEEIADELYISPKTVESHIYNIGDFLSLKSQSDVRIYAVQFATTGQLREPIPQSM